MGPKRNRDEKKRDRAITAELHLQGMYQIDIPAKLQELTGAEYKLSQQQISYDLKVIRRYWMMTAVKAIDQLKAEELAKIDYLEKTYWEAWHRSCGETVKTTTRAQRTGGEQSQANVTRTESREMKVGDPRFLEGVRWCIQKRIEILGLDAPQRIVLEKQLEEMGETELKERLQLAREVQFEIIKDEAKKTPADSDSGGGDSNSPLAAN